LQKIIAHAGVASRREAESMIRQGRVTVNGRVITELGTKADPRRDHVKVDGKLLTQAEPHRYILLYKPKEVMTTLEDPEGRRTVTIEGKRTLPCEIARIRTTGRNGDEGNSWLEVKLQEGRTQQLRKMFQAVGHPVAKLKRVAIGPISDPKLPPGGWRELTQH